MNRTWPTSKALALPHFLQGGGEAYAEPSLNRRLAHIRSPRRIENYTASDGRRLGRHAIADGL